MKLPRDSLAKLETFLADNGSDGTRDKLVAFVRSIRALRGLPIDRQLVSPIIPQLGIALLTGGDVGKAIRLEDFALAASDANCERVAALIRSLPEASRAT